MREKWSKYLFPIRFKQINEIITFLETWKADWALIKLKLSFSISPSPIHVFPKTLTCVKRNYLGFLNYQVDTVNTSK